MRPTHLWLLLALLGVWAPDAAGEETRWLTNADKAWTAAKKEKRPLLIYFTSSACHWCGEMKAKTFGNPEVAQDINKSFVAVSLKAEEESKLVEALKVTVFPTTVIISPEKELLERMTGYVPPSEFRKRLAEVTPKTLQR